MAIKNLITLSILGCFFIYHNSFSQCQPHETYIQTKKDCDTMMENIKYITKCDTECNHCKLNSDLEFCKKWLHARDVCKFDFDKLKKTYSCWPKLKNGVERRVTR